MNSNSAFKEVLENNKEFIDTLNNIVKNIIRKREDYINLENRITGRSFEREEKNKRDFNTFIYFDLEKELKLKKYKDFFQEINLYTVPNKPEKDEIYLKDKNDFVWKFKLIDGSIELLELHRIFSDINVVVSHQKYISAIYEYKNPDINIFSLTPPQLLFDLSEKELDLNEIEILLLTKDIDLKPLLDLKIKNIKFPFSIEEITLKSVYETKDEIKNKKKEGFFKRIFKL